MLLILLAYGQTGSGKTFTMEGPGYDAEIDMPNLDQEHKENRGMIPRSVEQIFETAGYRPISYQILNVNRQTEGEGMGI